MRRFFSLMSAIGVLSFATAAGAAPEDYHLDASAGTDFPVSINARVGVELPYRIRLSSSIGILPTAYAEAMNSILIGFGAYDDNVGDLILAALDNSLIWRTHVGVRPFRDRGFHVDLGYGLITLGGGATGAELLSGITGLPMPDATPGESQSYSIQSTLHMLDVEFGWEWMLAERLKLRGALGGAFTVASSTDIEPDFTPRNPRITDAFATAGEDYLNDVYTSYVFSPVMSVTLGYSFF